MANKSNYLETNNLKLILQNIALAAIGDASGLQPSATAGSLYIGLHSADPGEGGSQTTNELSYTGYARKAVARSAGGWTVTNDVGSNAAEIAFGKKTDAGTVTATHVSIGTDVSGAGNILFSKALTTSLVIAQNVTPKIAAGALTITEA